MQHTSQDFEKVVRRAGLKPIKRQHLKDGIYLYTAEGEKAANEEMAEPHWVVVWAAGFDDNLQFGQYIRIPTHVTLPHTMITTPTLRADRLAVAERQALELIKHADQLEIWNDTEQAAI